jgi:hypothetical protein
LLEDFLPFNAILLFVATNTQLRDNLAVPEFTDNTTEKHTPTNYSSVSRVISILNQHAKKPPGNAALITYY